MKTLARAMVPTMAVVLVPALVGVPASAAAHFRPQPGTTASPPPLRITNPNADGSYTAATSTKVTMKSSNGAVDITCASSAMKGRIDTQIGSTGSLNSSGADAFAPAFSDCRGADGSQWNATWQNNGDSGSVTAFAGGVATVAAKPNLRLTNDSTLCELSGGQVAGTYTNTGSRLVFSGAAVTSAGCGVTTADTLRFSLGYTVTPAITISDEPPIYSVSGSTGADGAFTSTGTMRLSDVLGGYDVTCAQASRSGAVRDADNVNGAVGSVSSASYEQCTDRFGRAVTIRTLDLPWSLKPQTYYVDQGLFTGQIGGAPSVANGLEVSLPGCSFTLTKPSGVDVHRWQLKNAEHLFGDHTVLLVSGLTGNDCRFSGTVMNVVYSGDLQPSTIQVTAR